MIQDDTKCHKITSIPKMENAKGLKITDDYVHYGPLETSFWSKTSTEIRINARVAVVVEFTS